MSRVGFFILLWSIIMPVWGGAQKTIKWGENYYDEPKGVVFNREFAVDLKIHTNGFGLGVNIGQIKTYYLTNYLHFEIGDMRHPKELRQNFDFQPPNAGRSSRSFIFGKQNSMFILRGGYGQKRYLSEKAKVKGLAIGLSYEGGPSLGLLKPYYMELKYFSEPGLSDFLIRSEKYSEVNADVFLDINRIYGAGAFTKGLGDLSILPGAHGKFAVHFDWGAFDEFVKALEAGIMLDLYFQNVPIMVESDLVENTENRPFFINLFLNLQFGKRW